MAVTPQTNVRLLKLPLHIDNKNQLTFSNETAQYNYFNSLDYIEIEDVSYQRRDNIIRYPAHIDSILQYNYCMYQNENYGNKWFYAFITNMQYENDGLTYIYITTDIYQTWQFDFIFKQSFVEREMLSSNDDVVGANLIPEGLETGEFKINLSSGDINFDPIFILAYADNEITINSHTYNFNGNEINGIPNSVFYILTDNLPSLLDIINSQGNGDKIITAFTIPKFCVNTILTDEEVTANFIIPLINNSYFEPIKIISEGVKPTSIDGYSPRNKKLLTYPYCYLGVTTPNSQKIYRYENFNINSNEYIEFALISEVNPNPTCYIMPQNYNGEDNSVSKINTIDAVTISGYPILSTRNEYFNTWLAQNSQIVNLQMAQEQYNYEISAIKGGVNLASNLLGIGASGSNYDLGSVGSGYQNIINSSLDLTSLDQNHEYYIKNQMAQIEKQKMLPDQVNMGSSNATLFGYYAFTFNLFTRFSIKRQFAERIDKFFDMYGYLTNTRKIPNLNNRLYWNYVKTIGANIIGDIPQSDLQALKNMFDNGITLWHDPTKFLDYSQTNS